MAVAVNIVINDTELVPQPIEGVVVNVYDIDDSTLISSATSDVDGNAALLLPGTTSPGLSYEVRFFKLGVLFNNPVAIAVIEPTPAPPQSNNFNVSGVVTDVLQPATNPRLCRVQGRFMNLSERPIPNCSVKIVAKADQPNPKYLDENIISASEMSFRTDKDGYLNIDLIRTGYFEIVFAGEDDEAQSFYVPDTSYAQWGDLINPYPVSIEWNQTLAPGNVVTVYLTPNGTANVNFTALFSNTQSPISGLSKWLDFFSSDPTDQICGLQQWDMGVFLRAVAPGTITVTGANKPCLLPHRIPYYSTVVPPLTVNVI
jgi:hypothetical protein